MSRKNDETHKSNIDAYIWPLNLPQLYTAHIRCNLGLPAIALPWWL